MVNFTTQIPDSHSCSFGFISSDVVISSIMAFPPLGDPDHVVVLVSIDFSINSKQGALFYCVAYDFFRSD